VTQFSKFRSQPSGNTGGQHDTLKTVMSRCELERKCRELSYINIDALPTHFMI